MDGWIEKDCTAHGNRPQIVPSLQSGRAEGWKQSAGLAGSHWMETVCFEKFNNLIAV